MILDGDCYSPLIQLCGVILSRMVEPYLYSVFSELLRSIIERVSLVVLTSPGVCRHPVFPLSMPLCYYNTFYVIFPRLLPFPLAKVYQHTSVLDVEVTLSCHERRVRLSQRTNNPFLCTYCQGDFHWRTSDVYGGNRGTKFVRNMDSKS